MGHDVVTHRKHYLKWVGEEQDRKRAMSLNIHRDIETKIIEKWQSQILVKKTTKGSKTIQENQWIDLHQLSEKDIE